MKNYKQQEKEAQKRNEGAKAVVQSKQLYKRT